MGDHTAHRSPNLMETLQGVWALFFKSKLSWEGRLKTVVWLLIAPAILLVFFRNDADVMLRDFLVSAYLFQLAPIVVLLNFGGLIREEVKDNTMAFLLVRPIGRIRLLFAKYLSQLVWIQGLLCVELALLTLIGSLRGWDRGFEFLPLLLQAQFFGVLAWSAVVTALGLFFKNYLPMGIMIGLAVEMFIGNLPTNINTIAVTRNLKNMLMENPDLFVAMDIFSNADSAHPVLTLILYTAIFLSISAGLFYFKEYLPSREFDR